MCSFMRLATLPLMIFSTCHIGFGNGLTKAIPVDHCHLTPSALEHPSTFHWNTVVNSVGLRKHPTDIPCLRLCGGKKPDFKVASITGEDTAAPLKLSKTRLMWRALVLSMAFSPPLATSFPAFVITPFREIVWYRMLAWSIGRSGAAFIKWGQWASVRPDMFPEALCAVLSTLHSSAPLHSWEFTRTSVERELGVKLEEYFDEFDPEPVASGSIAQVYCAWVRGQKVAVKVRHPGVEEQISMDFTIMRKVGNFIDSLPGLGWLNIAASMDQFSHTIAAQTRLDVEGNHLDVFNHNFRAVKSQCGFPAALFKSQSVLVESFEEGQICTSIIPPFKRYQQFLESKKRGNGDIAQPKKRKGWIGSALSAIYRSVCCCFGDSNTGGEDEEPEAVDMSLAYYIITQGTNIYMQMLLTDNLMHADLHPGNILVQHGDPDKGVPPRIVLVDAGMVATLQDEEQDAFIGFLQTMGEGDGRKAGIQLLKFSHSQTCTDPEKQSEFIAAMGDLFNNYCRGYGHQVDVGLLLRMTLQTLRHHQVRIDVNYATLVLNLMCLEGLAAALQPEYNLLDGARPLLKGYRRWAKGLFSLTRRLKARQDNKVYWRHRREYTSNVGLQGQTLSDMVEGLLLPVSLAGLALLISARAPLTLHTQGRTDFLRAFYTLMGVDHLDTGQGFETRDHTTTPLEASPSPPSPAFASPPRVCPALLPPLARP